MTDRLQEYRITLTENQRNKILQAYKKKSGVSLRLPRNQLTGTHILLLNTRQISRIENAKRTKTGLVLEMSYNQLKLNQSGGFLPLLLAGLAALGSLAGGGAAIANSVLQKKAKDKELLELERHNKAMEALQNFGRDLKKKKI